MGLIVGGSLILSIGIALGAWISEKAEESIDRELAARRVSSPPTRRTIVRRVETITVSAPLVKSIEEDAE
jgi:hypothetical protein